MTTPYRRDWDAAPRATPGLRVTRDAFETTRGRIAAAFGETLLAQAQSRAPSYAADQRDFAGLGVLGTIRELLAQAGGRDVHRLGSVELVERALAYGTITTSDFPGVLANTLNKTVRALYGAYPDTWSAWCDQVDVGDYRTITAAGIGQATEPQLIRDGGQMVWGGIAEDPAETYAVSERGVLLPIGKQALVNDDTRALAAAARGLALGAYNGLRRVVFGILTANANMADGVPLFSNSTGAPRGYANLVPASGMTADALSALRAVLQGMPGPRPPIGPVPHMPPVNACALLVPPSRETTALELLGDLLAPPAIRVALPTLVRSRIQPVMDAMLSTGNNPFYMVRTEPGMRVVEIAYINGRRTPEVTTAELIDYTGILYRCLFDFGAKAVTWRTGAGNLGT